MLWGLFPLFLRKQIIDIVMIWRTQDWLRLSVQVHSLCTHPTEPCWALNSSLPSSEASSSLPPLEAEKKIIQATVYQKLAPKYPPPGPLATKDRWKNPPRASCWERSR